jgi:hypothetical protein
MQSLVGAIEFFLSLPAFVASAEQPFHFGRHVLHEFESPIEIEYLRAIGEALR